MIRDLCGEVARASVGERAWVGEEEEEQKGEERSGRQGVGRKRVKITYVRDRASETGSRSGCVVGRPENTLAVVRGADEVGRGGLAGLSKQGHRIIAGRTRRRIQRR